ncbi:lipopolysaccharide biosynthesis protein [uncultured Clostridium sp.]|jgi:O-antigen/teichoic acid export membrane protein|uniref:lipopolysaccharide biosynthesis protein n=1 Tax=uncultured Clostridium sp. TaxID=59620 RepID=UPI002634C692|nr:lipopolysaccharide biosynthesis protein [uncultured Clostridium sp.]
MQRRNLKVDMIKDKLNNLKNNHLGKSFIVLLFGSGFGSALSLINLTIMINIIGIKENGTILMIQAYIGLFTGIFSFKSFEALIKYLTVTIHNNDIQKTKEYIKFSFILDIISVIFAFIFSYVLMGIIFKMMGWPIYLKPYICLYIIAILFTGTGTATGIIRVYDRFNDMVRINVVIVFIKFIFYLVAFFMKFKFEYFFAVEFIFAIITNLSVIIQGLYVLKEKKILNFYKVKVKFDKEYFMFNVYSSLYTTLDIPVEQITTFILNKYLGFSDVGVYNILTKIGGIILKIEGPLSQIIYPEMNKRIAKGENEGAIELYRKLFKNIAITGSIFSLILILTYNFWMSIFIKDYMVYFLAFIIYLIFIVYTSSSRSIHDLFVALGYVKLNVRIILIVNAIYLPLLFFMIINFHLNGVIVALLIQALLVIEIKKYILKKNKYKKI